MCACMYVYVHTLEVVLGVLGNGCAEGAGAVAPQLSTLVALGEVPGSFQH